jgi:predicted nucleic acid-binding protein
LPDTIIAATSGYLKLPLLTADKDFQEIENVELIFYQVSGNDS